MLQKHYVKLSQMLQSQNIYTTIKFVLHVTLTEMLYSCKKHPRLHLKCYIIYNPSTKPHFSSFGISLPIVDLRILLHPFSQLKYI